MWYLYVLQVRNIKTKRKIVPLNKEAKEKSTYTEPDKEPLAVWSN